jgi:hypothetical protein
MHDINDSAHKDTMSVLPHLNAVEGIINLVNREFLKVVVGAVATDIIDRVDIKKSASTSGLSRSSKRQSHDR